MWAVDKHSMLIVCNQYNVVFMYNTFTQVTAISTASTLASTVRYK